MRGIETLVVFSVTSLDLSVVPWGKRSDLLVPDPMLGQMSLE